MLYIGSHVSFGKDKQLLGSVEETIKYNANTFMFYTGAPQNTRRSEINDELTKKAIELMKENNIEYSKLVVHAPYIINLANSDESKYQFSIDFLKEECRRCDQLGVNYMVLHPGSHVGLGVEKGLDNIVNGLNIILEDVKPNVKILIETMAGKGTELGSKLEEVKYIIDNVTNKENIGVCLDTCHLNDSGINIDEFDKYLEEFDKKIGIEYIGCVHINDSKNEINSHKDRHENIGYGTINFESLLNVIYHEKLTDIPKILETPYIDKTYAPYKWEIKMIREKEFNPNLIENIKNE